MKAIRLSEEQLQAIQHRIQGGGAVVRTHTVTVAEEKRPTALKYGNKPTERDGIRFHSKREADRYQELLLMQSAREISALERQVPFDLIVNGVKVARYVADYAYRDKAGARVVEDAKGYATTTYKLKKKLMLACHGIHVRES